jgi:glucosamine--fructose-6-phosphate aminotransferase (isomerizing)
MCGIVGFAGHVPCRELLLAGLERLEYRGYDSAGIATADVTGSVETVRAVGNLAALRAAVRERVPAVGGPAADPVATLGIGHTRWATHGSVTEANAHPHADTGERFHIVLNGIIENHAALRERLAGVGAVFTSETDAEVLAHLVAHHYDGDLPAAARSAYAEMEGHYAFVVLSSEQPDELVAMRKECPLVVGVGEDGNFVASAVAAFLDSTNRVLDVEDGETVVVRADGVHFLAAGDPRPFTREPVTVDWDLEAAEKGGHETFLAKEIEEQPDAVAQTLTGRLDPDTDTAEAFGLTDEQLRAVGRLRIVACGTSYHSGLVARDLIEAWARMPVEVDIASEYRYRDPLVAEDELVVGITQSGETADTLAAMRLASARGATVLAVTNVMGSQATREADGVLFTRAGIEVSVAATKTFTTQVAALASLALRLSHARGVLDAGESAALRTELGRLPELLAAAARMTDAPTRELARELRDEPLFLFLGRHIGTPVAMEGALKLKELTYRPADAYAAGELKHGPIALIARGTPVVCVATASPLRDKLLSNMSEVRARGARTIAIVDEPSAWLLRQGTDELLTVPRSSDPLVGALLAVVPMQQLAHHLARELGLNVDQPRNLAKTVTVE